MPTVNETNQKISNFANVTPGWHYGDGIPADRKTIDFAHQLNNMLGKSKFFITDAFLGPGGQIQVNGYRDNYFLELIIEDGSIYFLLENENELVIEEMNLDIFAALSKVHLWGILLWDTIDFSIQTTLTLQEESSVMLPFLNPVMMVSQSWMANASIGVAEVSAHISENTTQGLPENHPFSLKSPKNIYQLKAAS